MAVQPVIDGFEFARSGGALEGRWPLAGFGRLQDALADSTGEIACAIRGIVDPQGRPALRLEMRGSLKVSCQRCLGALEYPIDVQTTLILAASQDEIDAAPFAAGEPDRVVASKEMRVADLIEDEMLLAIPAAPRHERCGTAGRSGDADERVSPFAGLRGMMQDKGNLGTKQR